MEIDNSHRVKRIEPIHPSFGVRRENDPHQEKHDPPNKQKKLYVPKEEGHTVDYQA